MGDVVVLYPNPKKKRPRRTYWITVPHGKQADQEPMASRTKAGALADVEFYDGQATVHKYELVEQATGLGTARRRFKRAVRRASRSKRAR